MLGKIFHWLMIAAVVVVAFWLMPVCGKIFDEQKEIFLFLWFFLPIVAFWLGSKYMRSHFTISSLTVTRTLLTCIMAFISMGFFANHIRIEEEKNFSGLEWSLFSVVLLLLFILLPCITWVGCTKGIEAPKREKGLAENEVQK